MNSPSDFFRAPLLAALEARGWTAADLARESGVGYASVNDYTRGRTDLYAATLAKLYSALGLSVSDEARPRKRKAGR